MNSFKFNFLTNHEPLEDQDEEEIEWLHSEEVMPTYQIEDLDKLVIRAKMIISGDIEIGHALINNMTTYLKENQLTNMIKLSETKHSDLITGKYEGGLKIWECTYDLLDYFEKYPDEINFDQTKVLDLGCGAGILGIYTFLKGANVTFQDYNKEVLEYCTIPNVLLNIEEEEREKKIKRCKFYSGDWASFDKILTKTDNFDIILTSETIYNQQNYNKLISLFQNRLTDNGCVFVAAKTHYFGVGGGTRQFEMVLKDTKLKSKIVWQITNGIQREILKINRLQ